MPVMVQQVTPVLRIFDVALARSFYVDYLGCAVDWEDGDALVVHLSTHHGDGTPGGVVLVEVRGIKELHEELHSKGYRFMNPGLGSAPANECSRSSSSTRSPPDPLLRARYRLTGPRVGRRP